MAERRSRPPKPPGKGPKSPSKRGERQGERAAPRAKPGRDEFRITAGKGGAPRRRPEGMVREVAPSAVRPQAPPPPREVTIVTVAEADDGLRLDRWFKQHYPSVPFGIMQRILRTGQVRVDGARAKGDVRLEAGQSVRVPPIRLEEDEPAPAAAKRNGAGATTGNGAGATAGSGGAAAPAVRRARGGTAETARALREMTLYEDKDCLVLNKPFGLAVQGGSGLSTHLDAMLPAIASPSGEVPRLVHRLDRDTAGCLVLAKSRKAASDLAKIFRSRSARKIYWALVKGVPKPKQGRISTYLAKETARDGNERMRVAGHGDDGASHAVTYYTVVETAAQKLAWLSLKPVTGRTHQLRAHTAHIGHPIVGDPKYFNIENWELPGGIQNRLHLLARRIMLPLPSGKLLDVTAPLPPHMRQSWSLLGFDAEAYDPIVEAPEE